MYRVVQGGKRSRHKRDRERDLSGRSREIELSCCCRLTARGDREDEALLFSAAAAAAVWCSFTPTKRGREKRDGGARWWSTRFPRKLDCRFFDFKFWGWDFGQDPSAFLHAPESLHLRAFEIRGFWVLEREMKSIRAFEIWGFWVWERERDEEYVLEDEAKKKRERKGIGRRETEELLANDAVFYWGGNIPRIFVKLARVRKH